MRELKGVVSGKWGVASASLAPDLDDINAVVKSELGIAHPLVTGTFNVKLAETKPSPIEECRYVRSNEILTFQKCRVKQSASSCGVQSVILNSSVHASSTDFQDTLEIMAPYHLCSQFSLKPGDAVIVEIEGDDMWWNLPNDLG